MEARAIKEEQHEFMYLEEVIKLTRMSESTIRRLRRLPQSADPFPEPVQLSLQLKVYRRSEVLAWLDRRTAERGSSASVRRIDA